MWMRVVLARLRGPFRREALLEEMEEEMRLHVEMEEEGNLRRGMKPEEAREAARRSFGNLGRIRDVGYDIRGGGIVDIFWQDLRYSVRTLKKSPGFTATALVTLALCIGANLTIFAVIDSVLLRPLPFADADRLVTIYNTYPKAGVERDGSSFTNYYERRGNIAALSEMAIYRD
jgi:hypothetical protein